MSSPLNSKNLSSIQNIDNEINEFISEIEKGHAPNPTKLLQIEKELKNLVKNKEIPDAVKQSLQTALQQLSMDEVGGTPSSGDLSVANLYGAKQLLDEALKQGKFEEKF